MDSVLHMTTRKEGTVLAGWRVERQSAQPLLSTLVEVDDRATVAS